MRVPRENYKRLPGNVQLLLSKTRRLVPSAHEHFGMFIKVKNLPALIGAEIDGE
jgi:hypothetical protein